MQIKVLENIKKYNLIEYGESVLVGLSGGADSVCLLHILYTIKNELGIKLFCSHINHKLRGKESDMDEEFVKDLCKKLGITLFSVSLNIKEIAKKENVSIEEAARENRYKQFALQGANIGNCKIAVGHNKNDQAETVMLNLIRGTGLDGLKGMSYKRGNIIRPLLNIKRTEIERYCLKHKLTPRVDSTNLEGIYTRNRIRLDLFPYISKEFKVDIVETINRMADLVEDDYSYLESVSMELFSNCLLKEYNNGVELNIEQINKNHSAIKKRIIRIAIDRVKGNLTGIEKIHIDNVTDLCKKGRTGAVIHLPEGVHVRKSYNALEIYIAEHSDNKKYKLKNGKFLLKEKITLEEESAFHKIITIPGITYIDILESSIEATMLNINIFNKAVFKTLDNKSLVQFFDYDKLTHVEANMDDESDRSEDIHNKKIWNIVIRGRNKGDILNPYRCKGTQKLKRFFINNKIPRDIRDNIPLIAKGKEIVWVIGYKTSDKFKITEKTKNILKLEYIKNTDTII